MQAKLDYLKTTPDIRGLHEKALLETAVFGLPMLGVNMPSGRGGPAQGDPITPVPVATGPGGDARPEHLRPGAVAEPDHEHEGPDERPGQHAADRDVALEPGRRRHEPRRAALPLAVVNATPGREHRPARRRLPRRLLHGLDGDPAHGRADDGGCAVSTRRSCRPCSSRCGSRPSTTSARSASPGTNLLVTPAQHRLADAALGTSTLRRYSSLDLRLFYSGNRTAAALSDAPSIVSIDAVPAAGGVDFTAEVVGDPAAAIHSRLGHPQHRDGRLGVARPPAVWHPCPRCAALRRTRSDGGAGSRSRRPRSSSSSRQPAWGSFPSTTTAAPTTAPRRSRSCGDDADAPVSARTAAPSATARR